MATGNPLTRQHNTFGLGKARGFTLLELLVAVGIFAIMAALAYAGLDAILNSRQTVETHLSRLESLQQAYVVMQRDITQAAPRTATGERGDVLPALRGSPDGTRLAVTRTGYPNPAGARRSHLLRVRYELTGTRLLRLQWPQIDRATGDQAQQTVLLEHVEALHLGYVDTSGRTQTYWPPAGSSPDTLPRAVRITLRLQWQRGPVSWLFVLP